MIKQIGRYALVTAFALFLSGCISRTEQPPAPVEEVKPGVEQPVQPTQPVPVVPTVPSVPAQPGPIEHQEEPAQPAPRSARRSDSRTRNKVVMTPASTAR